MKHNTLSLIATEVKYSVVPTNPREEVRKLFNLADPMPIGDVLNSQEFQTLQEDFDLAAEGEVLVPLDLSCFLNSPTQYDLRTAWIDYVEQRERLKDPKYRKGIIDMALSFSVKHAGIPVLSRPTDVAEEEQHEFMLDYQKRTFALALRGVYHYPAIVVKTIQAEMAKDFSSQFNLKDRMAEHDKFKAALAEGSDKHWAMQHCFDRLGVSAYPFSAPPQITALGNITKAMYDPILNPKEKNVPLEDRTFGNFVRAVAIYRSVWPEQSKTFIQGSFIRGLVAILTAFDTNVLKGTDTWIIQILNEAKDPRHELYFDVDGKTPIGFSDPQDWTNRHGWQANKFHQQAITSFANAWTNIRTDKRLNKSIPKLDQSPIAAFSASGVKMLDMKLGD
jgi:hypothetical protein